MAKEALKSIRIASLDIYNRLHSIEEDAAFVSEIADRFSSYPLFANQRCGAWYTDPARALSDFVYFKSTDGHYGQWDFNLRRTNLHLLPHILESNGMLLVDSTRSGKTFPDALSKTVPLWCAVINQALLSQGQLSRDMITSHGLLQVPPSSVSENEASQMRRRVNQFADRLQASSFVLPPLSKPLRPFWISPRSSALPSFGQDPGFYPVICVSASKIVPDGLERRQAGYTYVQGSGDDHESWSMGLTPAVYWKHKRELLAATQDDLPDIVKEIVLGASDRFMYESEGVFYIGAVGEQIAYSCGTIEPQGISIIIRSGESTSIQEHDRSLEITTTNGKRKQLDLLHLVLPAVDSFGRKWLDGSRQSVTIVDQDARYDEEVGVLMFLLGSFFDDDGREVQATSNTVSKESLRRRLEWIQSSIPRANPSRTTMKRVNEYAISRHRSICRRPNLT